MLTKCRLGSTGMQVTQLGFGAAELRGPEAYGGPPVTEAQAETILNAALDAGINFIDTADDYGHSEAFIGRFIGHRRDEYFLATKCGMDRSQPKTRRTPPRSLTRDNLMRNIACSLELLHTDHVDIMQLHNPSVAEVIEHGAADTLCEMRDKGLTRFIGISTSSRSLEAFFDMGVFDVFQVPYSCLYPEHANWMTRLSEAGCGVIVRSGLAKGDPHRAFKEYHREGYPPPPDIWALAKLDELVDGLHPIEMILRFTLSHPHCHTAVIGMLEVEHLRQNIAWAAKGQLDAGLIDEITRRVAAAREAHFYPWREEMRRLREEHRARDAMNVAK